MGGVAKLASKLGYKVTGCDLETSGHDPKHLKNTDLLIVTPAVYFRRIKDPELVEGERRKIVLTWQKFLGKYLQKGKKVICVAGTHGKSTTTAMVGKLLEDAGLDPQVTLGANYKNWGGGARYGKGDYFVTEADEFYDNFLSYSPEIIILNNIEFDHPDYFKSEKQIFESFAKFVGKLHGKKVLIVNNDSPGVQKLLGDIDTSGLKIIKYSLKGNNINLHLKLMGKHNVANALGVIALGKYLKIKDGIIKKSLGSFTGIERRMELVSGRCGIKVYDDYAHHPTAIKATIEAIREKYPNNRLWAVVEPHGYARTSALLKKYKGVFTGADKVIIGPVFRARDNETFGITPKSVVEASGHPDILPANSSDQIIEIIKKDVRKGDIILVMGAGKSHLWAKEICNLKI